MKQVSDYLFYKASLNRIPLQGTFELSPVCNFSCKMCYVRKTKEQIAGEGKRLLDWTEWLELGKKCRDAGTLFLLLTGGEPFIYPGFRELYEGLHKLGILLTVNTNGTMIDEETVEWLKTMAPKQVNITLYGANAETYRCLCGNADGYEKAKKAILMLNNAGIPVVINASMIPENSDDLEDIMAFGREHNINVRVSTYMFPPVRREVTDCYSRFTPEESALMYMRKYRFQMDDKAYRSGLQTQLEKVGKPSSNSDDENWGTNLEYMRCRAGRSTFWVSWDGSMTACAMLPFPIVVYPFEDDFRDCWIKLNEKVCNSRVMKGCNSCEKKELCHPCVAIIHAETGNVNDKAPYLCELTDKVIENIQKELKELGNNDE